MERKFNVTKNPQGFSVGDRVKVVKDDYTPHYVGKIGTVEYVDEEREYVDVLIDGNDFELPWSFELLELVATATASPAPITTKVIEGAIGDDEGGRYVGLTLLDEILDDYEQGDHVRITIEVIRKVGES